MQPVRSTAALVLGAILFAAPAVLSAQSAQTQSRKPPQPRETARAPQELRAEPSASRDAAPTKAPVVERSVPGASGSRVVRRAVPGPVLEQPGGSQECLDNPPATPTLKTAMLDPGNWEQRTEPFEDWLDTASDFLIEEIAKVARHQAAFSARYDRVVVLEDHQVKPQTAIATIKELSEEHVVDVHVLTHGTTNKIIGVTQGGTSYQFSENTFFGPLREAKRAGEPVSIRAPPSWRARSWVT